MARNIRFFYFGYQCPHNPYLLARIKTIAWQENATLYLHDVTRDHEACRKYRIFSPTMVIVNDKYRWHGPFDRERILSMLDEEDVQPQEFKVEQSDNVVRGELVPVDGKSVLETCVPCIGRDDVNFCRGKSEWVLEMMNVTGIEHLGYLHFLEGKCVGGAEFLPSPAIPYPVPDKRPDNALLTCSYASDEKIDFRTYPLERLASYLRAAGYDTLSVAASRDGVFPNGPIAWFERKGFKDRGFLIKEDLHKADIHYLQLSLQL